MSLHQSPRALAWELTRACDLKCLHCRAAGRPKQSPDELSLDEIKRVLDDLVNLNPGVLVLTGGDPFWRHDLEDIISEAKQRGLRVGLTPSATPRATRERIKSCVEAGVDMMAISLDGHCSELHDSIRNVEGTFDKTSEIASIVADLKIPLQVNTTLMQDNAESLKKIASHVAQLQAAMWSVFFLIHVGRGKRQTALDAQNGEARLKELAELSKETPFAVRTTAAPQYRRITVQQATKPGVNDGVTDGAGMCFISHTGWMYPSGFLPIKVGNVRHIAPTKIYYEEPLMKELKTRDNYGGKCGSCEYKWLCGGSRARAYAHSKNPLGEDPLCPYIPGSHKTSVMSADNP